MRQENTHDSEPISIVIPVYNEQDAVRGVLDEIKSAMDTVERDYEIIVVNDGSSDDTLSVLQDYPGIELISRTSNRGYGFSLKEGIANARHEWIIIIDADGTYPPSALPQLVHAAEGNDMVIAARNGDNVHINKLNKLAKVILRGLIFCLSGKRVHDFNSGLRIFKKSLAIQYWAIFPDRFSFTTTLTTAAAIEGLKTSSISIDYNKRTGSSSIKPIQDFLNFVFLILRLVVYFKPLNIFLGAAILFFVLFIARAIRDYLLVQSIGALAGLLFTISIQSFFFGLLADLVVKVLVRKSADSYHSTIQENADKRHGAGPK